MKICPQCHDEYRDEIAACLQCDIPLEQVLSGMPLKMQPASMVEKIDLATAVKVFEGALDACREVESLLKNGRIACALVPVKDSQSEESGAQALNYKALKYGLFLNQSQVEAFAAMMKARFDEMVVREHSKEWVLNDVHLDGSDVTCPACGHVGALKEGQCADCELFLGVNEA